MIFKMKKFSTYNIFKRKVLCILSNLLSQEERIPINNLFKLIDKDKDGLISFPEFKYAIKQHNFVLTDDQLLNIIQGLHNPNEFHFFYSEF